MYEIQAYRSGEWRTLGQASTYDEALDLASHVAWSRVRPTRETLVTAVMGAWADLAQAERNHNDKDGSAGIHHAGAARP